MSKSIFYIAIFSLTVVFSLLIVKPLKLNRYAAYCSTVLLAILMTISFYYFSSTSDYFRFKDSLIEQAKVKDMLQSNQGREMIFSAMKKRLQDNPDSAKGWYLLGRLYSGQGDWTAAQDAFIKASTLEPDNEAYIVNLAQSQWQLNNQKFNQTIRQKFEAILKGNPQQGDALAMLAMDAYQEKNYKQSILYWERLLPLLPVDHRDAKAVRKAIDTAQAQLNNSQ